MKNNVTELVFILDRSGSMTGLEEDTVGGFNSLIKKQRNAPGDCLVSTVLFANSSQVIHDRIPLQNVPPMTAEDYVVGGCTALIDAIGCAIHHIGNVHKYARKEDVPVHTLFVIMTDGMENASHIYSSEKVKKMIDRQQKRYGWEFLFLGANIDAVETAGGLNIPKSRSVDFHTDQDGLELSFDVLAENVAAFSACGRIEDNWSERLEKDNQRRAKQK